MARKIISINGFPGLQMQLQYGERLFVKVKTDEGVTRFIPVEDPVQFETLVYQEIDAHQLQGFFAAPTPPTVREKFQNREHNCSTGTWYVPEACSRPVEQLVFSSVLGNVPATAYLD